MLALKPHAVGSRASWFPASASPAPAATPRPLLEAGASSAGVCLLQREGQQHRLQHRPHFLRASSAAASATAVKGSGLPPSGSQQQQEQEQQQDGDVLIEFCDVHKAFGDKKILRGASFKIRRGEAVGIIGASGTGKSTTLRIAAGLLAPDKGEVLIMGKPRVGLLSDSEGGAEEHLRVGMVFQNAALFDSLTVGENVGFLLYEHSDLPEAKIKELVADSLAKVGLPGVEQLYPAELSGGMKKRVALARAVVKDVRDDLSEQVIMYDEPTAGLDPVASTVVEDLMRSLHAVSGHSAQPLPRKGISSYIVVTHQHSTIRRAVDRIIFLHKGKVVWEGSVEEFDTTNEPIVRQFAEGSLNGPIQYL